MASGPRQSVRDELAEIASRLLAPSATIGEIAVSVGTLEAFIERHTPFRRSENIVEGESYPETGWAVSPTQAAMCARDYRRTHAFARGLSLAVDDARSRAPGRAVRVLYAGCGPWATIALPALAAQPPGSVLFTLLDIHAESVESVRALIAGAGLGASVEAIAAADAATWVIQDGRRPDVIVSETMNVCLAREPQVAITRHLLAQAPDAILVPASIRIDAVLVDPDRERPRTTPGGHQGEPPVPDRVELGTVFELSRASVLAWKDLETGALPGARIRLPAGSEARYEPRLFTRIETYGGERLDAYESWLTPPRPFPKDVDARPGAVVAFRYELGAVPGLAAETSSPRWPDRLRLPFSFDAARLMESLEQPESIDWTDHFVTRNYDGHWSAIALRAPAGTERLHPILQITANPGVSDFVDTPALDEAPYLREVLQSLGFPLGATRLMRLDPGSVIKTHSDPDLAFEDGMVRLHIPVSTNPRVEFLVNGTHVAMQPGECWYLRLSDPHSVRNDGDTPRVHIVIDAPVTPALEAVFARARQMAESQAS